VQKLSQSAGTVKKAMMKRRRRRRSCSTKSVETVLKSVKTVLRSAGTGTLSFKSNDEKEEEEAQLQHEKC